MNRSLTHISNFLKQLVKDKYGGNEQQLVNYVMKSIAGKWKDQASEWVACPVGEESAADEPAALCPEHWAFESNRRDCEWVYDKEYFSATEDLSGRYYERVKESEYMELLLAMGGVRLGAILNSVLA